MRFLNDYRAHAFSKIGAGQHARSDAIFHRHIVREIIQLFAFSQLAQRDLAGLRAFGAQRAAFLRRPFAFIGV